MLLTKCDQTLFLIINKSHHPIIDLFFKRITNTFFWIPLYIILIIFIQQRLGWRGVLFFIIMLILSDQCSSTLLKPFIARHRPCYAAHMTHIHLVGTHIGMYGFPSSHASNTFAFAMLFWKLFHTTCQPAYLFFIWSTLISYGRIYGGMHYPLDVISGAILGCLIGKMMYHLHQK